mmetsp:Transcript_10376/g.30812  ORF Transcript_10376/g.30812 Transcript_10376/m.30812 type:complete len:263 (-) Transcript_10376:309-1097(-)
MSTSSVWTLTDCDGTFRSLSATFPMARSVSCCCTLVCASRSCSAILAAPSLAWSRSLVRAATAACNRSRSALTPSTSMGAAPEAPAAGGGSAPETTFWTTLCALATFSSRWLWSAGAMRWRSERSCAAAAAKPGEFCPRAFCMPARRVDSTVAMNCAWKAASLEAYSSAQRPTKAAASRPPAAPLTGEPGSGTAPATLTPSRKGWASACWALRRVSGLYMRRRDTRSMASAGVPGGKTRSHGNGLSFGRSSAVHDAPMAFRS